MDNKEQVVQECIWECRKTKIELEHDVLLHEMDVALVGLGGLPLTIITLIIQLDLWKNPILPFLMLGFAGGIIFFWYLRDDRKEKIVAKEKELDALMSEMVDAKTKKP